MAPKASGVSTPAGGWKNASAPATPYETVNNTNIGSPGGPPSRRAVESPSGLTPPAKRPADRASLQIAEIGERVMTTDELSAGFHQLLRRITREEAFTDLLRDAMIHNADLTDRLAERSAKNSVAINLMPTKFDQMEQDMTHGMLNLQQSLLDSDTTLRNQLDSLVGTVDKKIAQHAAIMHVMSSWHDCGQIPAFLDFSASFLHVESSSLWPHTCASENECVASTGARRPTRQTTYHNNPQIEGNT